ncbi:MAG TPA: hypothetical protein VN612_09320 [Acidobacteriaceae bacterium]|nr:hypothetical protein [Acidobacteriaceae bacterium]
MQQVTNLQRLLRLAAGPVFVLTAGVFCASVPPIALHAQATASPATPAPQRGTVKTISGNSLTVVTDAGPTVTIQVPDGVKISVLAVGSTDLKTATPSQFSDIAVGDRVLAAVKAGDTPTSFTARQVVLMKSADIAKMQADQQADWKANGVGGIVTAVDPATGAITLTSGTKKITVDTSSKTSFKRFAGDSVKYQDAKPSTLAQIQPKDQLQARGTKSADGLTVQATEVVSGSFKDLSGLLTAVDPATGKITLKDLATKKNITVDVTGNTNIRRMPPMIAQRFAAQANGGAGGRGGARAGGPGGDEAGGGPEGRPGGAGGPGGFGGRRSAGGDLAQMIAQFPTEQLADLQKNDAVMIVAIEPTPGASEVSAVTLLTGVDPILTANPNGGMDLSRWSLGGEGGGGGDQ